jgi:hypothetical protein
MRRAGIACLLFGVALHLYLEHVPYAPLGLVPIGNGWRTDYFDIRLFNGIKDITWSLATIYALTLMAIYAVWARGYPPVAEGWPFHFTSLEALAVTYLLMFLLGTQVLGIATETRLYLDYISLWIVAIR